MAKAKLLPIQDREQPIPHFPTRMHAAIFRLWETVPKAQIAKGLDLSLEVVQKAADAMGLKPQKNMENWAERGYISTIRNVWYLLPYEQLLKVLDWTEERLAFTLKEEDFLGAKLGYCKPNCPPVREETLTAEQEAQLGKIKKVMESDFQDFFEGVPPFSFFEEETPIMIPASDGEDGLRMIYSFCGLYGNVFDQDISLSFPEEMMKRYQAMGVNAIWMQAVLYQLTPFPFDESYSVGWEKRQERLREIIALGEKYGIKVYLYLNEPRAMQLPFFEKYPDLLGAIPKRGGEGTLCTSDPRTIEYLYNAVKMLCEAAPGLGGFFLINLSENLTHCKYVDETGQRECPRCKEMPKHKAVSKIVSTIYEAANTVTPAPRVISWSWGWQAMSEEDCLTCIEEIPAGVIMLNKNEEKKEFTRAGVSLQVGDYSISVTGTSARSKMLWEHAKKNGHDIAAKLQLNNSWECSTVPYLPVFDLLRENMTELHGYGVKHIMASWTLGGYPSINLKVAFDCLKDPSEERYDALLQKEFGKDAALVKKAAAVFSEAFREFPFDIRTLYYGPHNPGPSNLLYETDTGLPSSMTCYAFDCLRGWCQNYPRETYREQFYKLQKRWKEGLDLLGDMEENEFKIMAEAAYTIFYSSYLQIDFIMRRDSGEDARARLLEILQEERALAIRMFKLMQKHAGIGYEAANHYYYTKGMLAEKVLCCDHLAEKFSK